MNTIRATVFLLAMGKLFSMSAQEVSNTSESAKVSYRQQHIVGLSTSYSTGNFAAALDWSHLHGIGKGKKRFKIGYGIRYTGYIGADKQYTTAPSKFTSTVQSLGTLFSETILDNIDTLTINNTGQTNSVNVSVHLEYTLGKGMRTDLGFNIDAIGYSFGTKKIGTITSSVLDASSPPVIEATPTKLNLLLTSDNDIGSLNSEFYLRRWNKQKNLALKVGFTFYFSEYTTTEKLSFDNGRILNDRFRYKSSMAMIGICWKPFNK
jgi:hypothetical protein